METQVQDEWLTQENLEYMASYLGSEHLNYDNLLILRQCWKAYALKAAIKLVPLERQKQISAWVVQQNEQLPF